MAWTRQLLSVMGLIMAQLVFGGISLSLGVMVGVLLLGVAIIVLLALAACGFCFILERLGLVAAGWTDEQLQRLKVWAKGSPQMITLWKDSIKKEIRDYLEDRPDTTEQRLINRIKRLQVIVIMQAIVIAILLVMQTTSLSVRGAILVVVALGAVIAVATLYMTNAAPELREPFVDPFVGEGHRADLPGSPSEDHTAKE
jgi:hypothetical protein